MRPAEWRSLLGDGRSVRLRAEHRRLATPLLGRRPDPERLRRYVEFLTRLSLLGKRAPPFPSGRRFRL